MVKGNLEEISEAIKACTLIFNTYRIPDIIIELKLADHVSVGRRRDQFWP